MPVKLRRAALRDPWGDTLGPKVITGTHIFAIRIQVRFLSATWERQTRRLEAIVGPAEGGEASHPSFAKVL